MPKVAYTREDGAKDIPLDAKIKKPKNFKQQTFYNKKKFIKSTPLKKSNFV